MRTRDEALKTGSLLVFFHPEDRKRNASILFLVKGVEDIEPLSRIEESLEQEIGPGFGWYAVADQLELSAVDPNLDSTRMSRFEVEEFRELEASTIRAILAPTVLQLQRGEPARFPSARRVVGSVPKGEDLFGREQEIGQLMRLVEQGQNVLLVAPRRSGKTAVLYRLAQELERRFHPVFVDAERFSVPEGLAADLLMRTSKQSFTAALREVRQKTWQVALGSALETLAGDRHRPLVLILDELVMYLQHLEPGDARELLSRLGQALKQVGGCTLLAGSFELEEFARSQLQVELPRVLGGLHRFPLPPLAEAQLDIQLRRLLLGTGLVPEPGDLQWLAENVDLAMPYPALCLLEEVASKASVGHLGREDLDRALQEFLEDTDAFDAVMEPLDKKAQKDSRVAEAWEQALERLALEPQGLPVEDVRELLGRAQPGKAGELFGQLLDGFPLRHEGERVRMASRLFRQFWRTRQERA